MGRLTVEAPSPRIETRSTVRSHAWLKLKPTFTLTVHYGRIIRPNHLGRLGRGRDAAVPPHPPHGPAPRSRSAGPCACPRDLPFDLRIGARLELVCWGVMPSGMLRHPVGLAQRPD